MELRKEGKLSKGSSKDIRTNMELAVKELAAYNSNFEKYRDTIGGKWKKRKYDVLYQMTKRFTEEFVGTIKGEQL